MFLFFPSFWTHVVSSFFATTYKLPCRQFCAVHKPLYFNTARMCVLHESMEQYRNVLETSCGESCQNFSFHLLVQIFFDFLAMILLCYVPKIVAVYDLRYMFNIPTDILLCSVTPKIFMNMAR